MNDYECLYLFIELKIKNNLSSLIFFDKNLSVIVKGLEYFKYFKY